MNHSFMAHLTRIIHNPVTWKFDAYKDNLLNDINIMATNPGGWGRGQPPIRTPRGGEYQALERGSVGPPQGQPSTLPYVQQIGSFGTITGGLLDITSIPNNYLSYQQHASSSSRTPAHENQCITTMTSINDLQNPSLPAHSTIGNQYPSTSNQNTHLRRMLATTSQTNCSQDVRIFQVPKQNQRQNSSINQGQAGSSGGLQSGWHSSSAFPPPHNMYPHHQGYTEVRNSIQVPNPASGNTYLMRDVADQTIRHQAPNVTPSRIQYSYRPTQARPQSFNPPTVRNMPPQQPTHVPQVHPAFRPPLSLQSSVNQMNAPPFAESEWQFFQQKISSLALDIPHGINFRFFIHCQQMYGHYQKNFSMIPASGYPASFNDFCAAYIERHKHIGTFTQYCVPNVSVVSQTEEEEPSDKVLLGHWYRLPEDKQEEVTCLRSVNRPSQSESTVFGMTTNSVSQTNDSDDTQHIDVSLPTVCAGNNDDNTQNEQENVPMLSNSENNSQASNSENNSQAIKVEVDENWDSDQNPSLAKEIEESESRDSSDQDEVDGTPPTALKVKLPFHPPSKTKTKMKNGSADEGVKLSHIGIRRLSEVLNKVMMETKKPSIDTGPSMAKSILEIEPTAKASVTEADSSVDCVQTPVNKEIPLASDETEPSDNSVGTVATCNINKRKRFPTEVDSGETTSVTISSNVHPPKKLRTEIDGEATDLPKPVEENLLTHQAPVERETKSDQNGAQDSSGEVMACSECGINTEVVTGETRGGVDGPTCEMRVGQKNPSEPAASIFHETRSLFPIKFHGETVLCIKCENRLYLLMREILKKNFASLAHSNPGKNKRKLHAKYFTAVFLAKERDLNIPYKQLPEEMKAEVKDYMLKSDVLTKLGKGRHIGIIHINDAHRLYQYFFGLKHCGDHCIVVLSDSEEAILSGMKASEKLGDGDSVQETANSETDSAQETVDNDNDCVQDRVDDDNDCVQERVDDDNDCVQERVDDDNDCVQERVDDDNDCVQGAATVESDNLMGYDSDATIPYGKDSDSDDYSDIILVDFSLTDTPEEFPGCEEIKTEEMDPEDSNLDNTTSMSYHCERTVTGVNKQGEPTEEQRGEEEGSEEHRTKDYREEEEQEDIMTDLTESSKPNCQEDELEGGINLQVNQEENILHEPDCGLDDVELEKESQIPLRGGIAPLYQTNFRFLIIDGIKFYPLVDLTQKFKVQELIECMKLRENNKYQAMRCDWKEADFFCRLEPALPEVTENAILLEEEILFDIAHKTRHESRDSHNNDLKLQEVNLQPKDKSSASHCTIAIADDEDELRTEDEIPLNICQVGQGVPEGSNTGKKNLEEDSSVSKRNAAGMRLAGQKEAVETSVDSCLPRQPCTPVHSVQRSEENADLCQTNEVSSTVLTPASERRQVPRNLTKDLTTDENEQNNEVESSSLNSDCIGVYTSSPEANNNSRSASDAMVEPGILQEVQAMLSSIPPSAKTAQIDQALHRFFETCQDTCSGSHEIVSKAFVSVLKQNLILQNELNNLRSGIAEMKGDKDKLDAATKRCKEITKEMTDIEEVLMVERK
ncbi:uncharacterized protein LOC111128674 isoform X4 [Crassostrea virginica]